MVPNKHITDKIKITSVLALALIVGCVGQQGQAGKLDVLEDPVIFHNKTGFNLSQIVDTEEYKFHVPEGWWSLDKEYVKGTHLETYYRGDGVTFKPFYKNGPVIVNLWSLTSRKYASLEEATDDWKSGYTSNKDRVFYDQYPAKGHKIRLKDGKIASVMHVNFYRLSKELNQSRFDMLVFNEVSGKTHGLTMTVEYLSAFGDIEGDLSFPSLAEGIFETFEIK
ncbi:MAG: hypothetical protein HZB68_04905 [Candidatus Aenigmarchaeota archaeon]|nr:hypothetical protein [Candidatus Aenigmarchaeota archaeon]